MRITSRALLMSLVLATLPLTAGASSSKQMPNFRIQEPSEAEAVLNECYMSYFQAVFEGLSMNEAGQVIDPENAKLLKILNAMEPELSIVARLEGAAKSTGPSAPQSKIQTSFYLVDGSDFTLKLASTPIVDLNDKNCQIGSITPAVRNSAHQSIKALYAASVIHASREATAGLSGVSEDAKSNRSLTSSLLKNLDKSARR